MKDRLLGTRRKKVVAVLLVLLVIAVSAAIAGWIVSARSGASAKVADLPVAPTVSPSATPTADLSPGATGSLAVDVTNPNAYALTLRTIGVVNMNPNGITTGDSTACPAGHFTVSFSAQSGLSVPIPVGGPTKVILPGQSIAMAADAPTTCAGRTIQVSTGVGSGWDLGFSGP